MKVYTLTIMYDEESEEIEYIEEEITEDYSDDSYEVMVDPDYYDSEIILDLIEKGLIAES